MKGHTGKHQGWLEGRGTSKNVDKNLHCGFHGKQWARQGKQAQQVLECSNYCTIALISHDSKAMLKILQARLQQYMDHEIPEVQAGFRNGRGTSNQIANIHWIIEKAREFQKNIYFCFINFVWITANCEKFFKRWEYGPPYLPHEKSVCQEATLRTGHGTIDWCQIRKGVHQGYTLLPCSFNLRAEYIMQSAGLDEAQAGIKIARKNNQ